MNQSSQTNSFHADGSFTLEAMKSLGDLLSASAARNPQRTAIAFEDRSISYESLSKRPRAWRFSRAVNPVTASRFTGRTR